MTLYVNGVHSPVNKWISNIYCSSCLSFNDMYRRGEKTEEDSPQKGKLSSGGAEARFRQRDLKFKMAESPQKSKGSVCQEDAIAVPHQQDT